MKGKRIGSGGNTAGCGKPKINRYNNNFYNSNNRKSNINNKSNKTEKNDQENEKSNLEQKDEELNSGFGEYLRSPEAVEMMKLFVFANSIMLILTMAWPNMKDQYYMLMHWWFQRD